MNRLAALIRRPRAAAFVSSSVKSSTVMARSLSTSNATFSDREKGEEARYFRQEEERLKAEARAKFEALLAKTDDDEKRQQLLSQLAEKDDSEKSFFDRVKKHPFSYMPAAALILIPAIANDFLILNEESILLAVAMGTYGITWLGIRRPLEKAINEEIAETEQRYRAVDEAILSSTRADIETAEEVKGLDTNVKELLALADDLHTVEAESLTAGAAAQYREAVVRKLEQLSALEEKVSHQVKSRMIEHVKADVKKRLSEKKTKEAALEAALAVLSGGKGAKLGNDVVAGAFKQSIANYRDVYAKQDPSKDDILLALDKEVAAIVSAPHLSATGGNVYETNPLFK